MALLLISGCASKTSATATVSKPTDLPPAYTWHDIPGENCGVGLPDMWPVHPLKDLENLEPSAKGSAHDISRQLSAFSASYLKKLGDHGIYATSLDPVAGAIVVSHREDREDVDLSQAAAQAASAIASAPMRSDVPPTASIVKTPMGDCRLVQGEFSGANSGQPDLKMPIRRYIWAHGKHRYDVLVIWTSVGEPIDAETIAQTFRFANSGE